MQLAARAAVNYRVRHPTSVRSTRRTCILLLVVKLRGACTRIQPRLFLHRSAYDQICHRERFASSDLAFAILIRSASPFPADAKPHQRRPQRGSPPCTTFVDPTSQIRLRAPASAPRSCEIGVARTAATGNGGGTVHTALTRPPAAGPAPTLGPRRRPLARPDVSVGHPGQHLNTRSTL